MRKLIACLTLLVAAAGAQAQVTLSLLQNGVETPVGAGYIVGQATVGSALDTAFRLTNTGADIYLTSLAFDKVAVSPAPAYVPSFGVACAVSPQLCGSAATQQLPIQIGAGGTLDFTVAFKPFEVASFSATMTIAAGNTITVILVGTGVSSTGTPGGLTVLLNNQPLTSGQTIGFGSVQTGSSQTIKLTLANQTTAPVAVPAIGVLVGAFSLGGGALTATTLGPGSSAELDVTFAPTAAGPSQGTLSIGQVTYPLTGTGETPTAPAFPAPTVQLTLATSASAQQGSISITLASASAASGGGTLALTFQSAVSGVGDDPSITFADGTRSAAFTVAEGASEGQFAGGPSVAFGTGTTAGTITFTVTLGSQTAQASATIPAATIGIDAAVAARDVACAPAEVYCTTTNVELQINGWDNTRSISTIVFAFFDASGNPIAPGNISVAAASSFGQYFAGSDLGGVFGLHALFPVTGSSGQVVAAQVQLTNSAGTAQTQVITF